MASQYKVVTSLYAPTFKSVDDNGKGKSKNNTILMGSYVKLLDEATDTWQKVVAFSIEGWIEKKNLGDSPGFKCFYVDVGQGDADLIEEGNDENGLKILIDGGPGDNLSRYLSKWQYKYYFNLDKKVHFDGVVLSRHGIPVPRVQVNISIGHGEHSGGAGSIQMTTNEEGKFENNSSICNNCWASSMSTSYTDSGHFESKSIGSIGQSNMVLVLE